MCFSSLERIDHVHVGYIFSHPSVAAAPEISIRRHFFLDRFSRCFALSSVTIRKVPHTRVAASSVGATRVIHTSEGLMSRSALWRLLEGSLEDDATKGHDVRHFSLGNV
jgi:hypothetical protein